MAQVMDPEAVAICLKAVHDEYVKARRRHEPMHDGHHGYAVILEEVEELWEEVKKQHPDSARLFHEATQVAAMGLAFMLEVAGRQWKADHADD